MTDFKHVCSLGAGVIGASWTALFLASGRTVAVYDPAPGAEKALRELDAGGELQVLLVASARWPGLPVLRTCRFFHGARRVPDAAFLVPGTGARVRVDVWLVWLVAEPEQPDRPRS